MEGKKSHQYLSDKASIISLFQYPEDHEYREEIIRNLVQQLEEQKQQINSISKQCEELQSTLKSLLEQLGSSELFPQEERRKPLMRNNAALESLINTLTKKHVIHKRELLYELKKLRKDSSINEVTKKETFSDSDQ